MKAQVRRTVTAALLAAMALGGTTLGGTAALADEGGGGQSVEQRTRLKAAWAEARARNGANADATLVERLFGVDGKETAVASAHQKAQPKKK